MTDSTPRSHHPAFVPHKRALLTAAALASVAAILISLSPRLPLELGYVYFGAVVAAFLLFGTALRPRANRLLGLALGIGIYLGSGVASVVIFNRNFLADLDALAWILQTLVWPGLWYLGVGGFLD